MDNAENLIRMAAELGDTRRRLDILEHNDRRHDEDIRQLYAAQEGTKAYVTQILARFDSLETKLFSALSQATGDPQQERKGWQELIKHIITATIVAVVTYVFAQGGVGK